MTGGELKALRKAADITQQELAKELGLHWITISRFENGQAIPKATAGFIPLAIQSAVAKKKKAKK